ncbi:MAG: SDR family oxidoreductase [Gammaproteobacteria bacterium]|jgi:NAD(P)-dependent dehydrogenase (short-subunit alcohol dehydrogenase family)
MPSILITGSNRGLGLEWARQYAQDNWRVYATCRFPEQAGELQQIADQFAGVSIHAMDVTRPEQLAAVADEVEGSIDILVNNAGVYHERWGKDPLGDINYADWQDTFNVNTLGPMRVCEQFINFVAHGQYRLVVAITSHMGSIADITSPNDYAYRSSKAALNAAMKGLSVDLASRSIGVLLLHPGWVRTRMGGDSAPISPQQSVNGMRKLVTDFNMTQSGHFYRFDGSTMPW